MSSYTKYESVAHEVAHELALRVEAALEKGVNPAQIVVDPGLGFAKTAAQNFELLRRLDVIAELGFPLCVGASRKSFIGRATWGEAPEAADPTLRLEGSLAAAVAARLAGARILRVHDVAETKRALAIADALITAR